MDELIKKYSDVSKCPIRNVVSHFSSKWGILIILILGDAEYVRFNELTKLSNPIFPIVIYNYMC